MAGPPDGTPPRSTKNWAVNFSWSRGPAWFGLRRARTIEIQATLQGLRQIRIIVLGLGAMAAIVALNFRTPLDRAIDVADRKTPDWQRDASDPDRDRA